MAKLKDPKNYTPEETEQMAEMLKNFNGDMGAYNKWWEVQNDSSIDNWEKALDKYRDNETKKGVPEIIGYANFEEYMDDFLANPPEILSSSPEAKKVRDLSGLPKHQQEKHKDNKCIGNINKPRIKKEKGAKLIQGDSNCYINLSSDQTGGLHSGYQATWSTHAASIDLCAGPMGHNARATNHAGKPIIAEKDFISDSARVYISQKTDIDHAFGCVEGNVGNWTSRSGVGIKADHVRVIAREGIKLITKTDLTNSQGGDIKSTYGIDIIAGNNDDYLQPMVLGYNLVDTFGALVEEVEKLSGIIEYMLVKQNDFNAALQQHDHKVPLDGDKHLTAVKNTIVYEQGLDTMHKHFSTTQGDLAKFRANLKAFTTTFLIQSGGGYICSRQNRVN